MTNPIERVFGSYRISFRKAEQLAGRPTPHVEVWKERRKIGNYDMASGEPLPGSKPVSQKVAQFIKDYLTDPRVQNKVKDAIEESFFDLSKPAGDYGAIPRGFKAEVRVWIPEDNAKITDHKKT